MKPARHSRAALQAATQRLFWAVAAVLLLLETVPAAMGAKFRPYTDPGMADMLADWYAGKIPRRQGGYSGVLTREQAAAGVAREPWMAQQAGAYTRRAVTVQGIEIWAFDIVGDEAVQLAAKIIGGMLEASPQSVSDLQVQQKHKYAIIGRTQLITEVPEYEPFKDFVYPDGRRFDSLRGAGAVKGVPVSTTGEENILELADDPYANESILVHEFGHGVMNLGLDECNINLVKQRFKTSKESGVYVTDGVYMMRDEFEYFAVATQSWFDAVRRTDTSDFITDRDRMNARDPGLAELMQKAYGAGAWRYRDSCINCNTKWDWNPIAAPAPGNIPLVYLGALPCDAPPGGGGDLTCKMSDLQLPQAAGGSCTAATLQPSDIYTASGTVTVTPELPADNQYPVGDYSFTVSSGASSCTVGFKILACPATPDVTCKTMSDVQLPQAAGGSCTAATLQPSDLYTASGTVTVTPELPTDNQYPVGDYSFTVSSGASSCTVRFKVLACPATSDVTCKTVSNIQLPQAAGGSCTAATLQPSDLYTASGTVTVTPELPADNQYPPGDYSFTVSTATTQCGVAFFVAACSGGPTALTCNAVTRSLQAGSCDGAKVTPDLIYSATGPATIQPQLPMMMTFAPGSYSYTVTAADDATNSCTATVEVAPCTPTCTDKQVNADQGACVATVAAADMIDANSYGAGATLSLDPPGPYVNGAVVTPAASYAGGVTGRGAATCTITVVTSGASGLQVTPVQPQCVYRSSPRVKTVCFGYDDLFTVASCGGGSGGGVTESVQGAVVGGAKSSLKIYSVSRTVCLSLAGVKKTGRVASVRIVVTDQATSQSAQGTVSIRAVKSGAFDPSCKPV